MSINALSILSQQKRSNILQERQNTNNKTNSESTPQNKGGLWGGIKYLGNKFGAGFLRSIEGIWDYTAGGIADFFGADQWAERQFANDWINYNHADEWYNPSDGWKFAGDIAGGIGSSAPALLAAAGGAALVYATGGAAAPAVISNMAKILPIAVAGLGAAGNATREAYTETGELGANEYGYGALVGGTEAVVEKVTAGLGTGGGRIIKSLTESATKSTAKQVGKTVVKSGAKTVFKNLAVDFASEAIEEGIAEFMAPYYKRATYDPNAKNATPQELGYAALVGGLSGAITGGAFQGATSTVNYFSGSDAVKKGTAASIIETARQISESETKNDTGYEVFKQVQQTYSELQSTMAETGGQITTAHQKRLLGQLKRSNAISPFMPYVEKSAEKILLDPESVIQRYNEFGMTDANGNPIVLTVEQLLSGIDRNSDRKTYLKSLRRALSTNSVLTTLAVADATGNIMMDSQRFADAALLGSNISTSEDLNRFIETAPAEMKNEVGRELCIDDWNKIDVDEYHSKVEEYAMSGKMSTVAAQAKRRRNAESVSKDKAIQIPQKIVGNMADGTYRYASEDGKVNLGVIKEGESYYLYDYDTRNISKAMKLADVNAVIKRYWTEKTLKVDSEVKKQLSEQSQDAQNAAEIDAYARKHIKEYKMLSAPNQAAIRATIRQARAHGLSEADTLMFARVSARSGVNISFKQEPLAVGIDKQGNTVYSDGMYDGNNTIYINKNSKRKYKAVLIHEMRHFLTRASGGVKADARLDAALIKKAIKKMDKQRYNEIYDKYYKLYSLKKSGELKISKAEFESIIEDEISAHYTEELFADVDVMEFLFAEKPGIRTAILGFFGKAARDYSSSHEILSSESRRYFAQFRKLFQQISERNQGNNDFSISVQNAMARIREKNNANSQNVPVTRTRYAIKYPVFSETDISRNIDELADMEAVVAIDASKLKKTGKSPRTILEEFFASIGNSIYSDVYGDISLGKSSVKSEIRHGITAEKIASIEAIPAVIEQGKVIFHKAKEGGVERIVVCAPIKIGEADYYTGVMLQRDARYQRLYLHNVVSVVIEREVTSSSKDNLVTTGALEEGNHLSITSIIQKALNVKAEKQKSAKKTADTSFGKRFALPEDFDYAIPGGDNRRFALAGFTKDGIEVYETSREVRQMSMPDRINKFRNDFGERFKDTTVKLEREGETVYARFVGTRKALGKFTHEGSNGSDHAGYRAKLRLLADGDIISIVDGSKYNGYENERGKDTKAHKYAVRWDYYYKTVVVDGKGYDITVNVRNVTPTSSPDTELSFVYSMNFYENNDIDTEISTEPSAVRYAIDLYSETQYNSFGWARYAGVLTKSELDDLYAKIQARMTLRTYKQSSRGEAIIEVNNTPHTTLGVDNVFVFVKGSKNDFKITRVVRFNAETETEMEIIKEELYERGTFSDTHLAFIEQKGFATQHTREGAKSFAEYQRLRASRETSRGTDRDNRRSKKYGSGYSLVIGEDGEIISETFKRNALPEGDFDAQSIIERGVPNAPGRTTMTVGQVRKVMANATHKKVYSREHAFRAIRALPGVSDLSLKGREEIAGAMWKILNSCKTVEERKIFSHDMAEYIVAKLMTEAKVENPEVKGAVETLSYLRVGIGSVTFYEDYLNELRHKIDVKELKRILGRWGFKKRRAESIRYPMDVFVSDIAREMPGMEYLADMHPVEAFLEIDKIYDKALKNSRDKWISAYHDMPDSEIPAMIKYFEDEIFKSFEREGEPSKFTKYTESRIEHYKELAEYYKAAYLGVKGKDRWRGLLDTVTQKLRELKNGTFWNSIEYRSNEFKTTIEQLTKIQYRGNVRNAESIKKLLQNLMVWYNPENPMLNLNPEHSIPLPQNDTDVQNGTDTQSDTGDEFSRFGEYEPIVYKKMKELVESQNNDEFNANELGKLYDIMSYFIKFMENYDKVFFNEKLIEALPKAEKYVSNFQENSQVRDGIIHTYYYNDYGDPTALVKHMDNYAEDGFFTEMLENIRAAEVNAELAEMEIKTQYDEFLKKNKKYVQKAIKTSVEYKGVEIPKMILISLYMTMKRVDARPGILSNGFCFKNEKQKVDVDGWVSESVSDSEFNKIAERELEIMEKLLSDTDREYIAILEKAYNQDAKLLKRERDIQRIGFSNVKTGYYYPKKIAYKASKVSSPSYKSSNNPSFNKSTKSNQHELFIESADTLFNRYIHEVCQYAYIAPAIDAYNKLYNLNVGGNNNKALNVARVSENIWRGGHRYFKELFEHIQKPRSQVGDKKSLYERMRNNAVAAALGANPKVLLSQFSSFISATCMLDYSSVMQGMFVSSNDVDRYCPLAKLRDYSDAASKAMGLFDTISAFGEKFMFLIGKTDRFVICRLFGACQVQIEKNGGPKVGTERNKIEAGKLLHKVILETQQNSFSTSKSAAMRSKNILKRDPTMFSADSMKLFGRVVEAFGEYNVLRKKLKLETNPKIRENLSKELKTASRKLRKAAFAQVLAAVFMVAVAELINFLYNKKSEDDEDKAKSLIADFFGNLLGGLPVIRDVYSFFIDGYEMETYAFTALNDLLGAVKSTGEWFWKFINGRDSTQEKAQTIKKVLFAFGQFTGIPTRNLYNLFYGITNRISPSTGYKIDSVFYEKNYRDDFYEAIENNDAGMASMIMSMLYNERINEDISESLHNELYSLSEKGYKVIPKSTAATLTYENEEYELDEAQREAFRTRYVRFQPVIESAIKKAQYKNLTDAQKAEFINYVYELYYTDAKEYILGIGSSNKSLLMNAVGAEALALLNVKLKGVASDVDKNGNTVTGSKKKKVIMAINSLNISLDQKILLIYSKGYTIKDDDIRGVSESTAKTRVLKYILSLKGVTKEEKGQLAEMCGFTVKNGKIILNKA